MIPSCKWNQAQQTQHAKDADNADDADADDADDNLVISRLTKLKILVFKSITYCQFKSISHLLTNVPCGKEHACLKM